MLIKKRHFSTYGGGEFDLKIYELNHIMDFEGSKQSISAREALGVTARSILVRLL